MLNNYIISEGKNKIPTLFLVNNAGLVLNVPIILARYTMFIQL